MNFYTPVLLGFERRHFLEALPDVILYFGVSLNRDRQGSLSGE